MWDGGYEISNFELRIANLERHGAWGKESGVRIQNPEFRRKAIKIEFLSTTGYWILCFRIAEFLADR